VARSATTLAGPADQRTRILDTALHLMAGGGVHAMSMRQLAAACGLNVATLYHYFPSKADLLAGVVASRHYPDRLPEEAPVDPGLAARERLASLLRWVWGEMAVEEDMWRLLLGESLRGDPAALESAALLTATFEGALEGWLRSLVPELRGDPVAAARVVRGLIYGFFVEHLPIPGEERTRRLARRAEEIADVLLLG